MENETKIVTYTGNTLFGLRGIYNVENGDSFARLSVVVQNPTNRILLLDIPTGCLPYTPDLGPDSEFKKNGDWHHFSVNEGYSVTLEEREGVNKNLLLCEVTLGEKKLFSRVDLNTI